MLFKINKDENKDELVRIKRVNLSSMGWVEKDLEELISNNITTLIPENQLMILAQERKRQEEADIFAIDEDGTLYIFELKRWQSNKENILQVLRYGQIFGQYSYEKLEKMFQQYSKDKEINLADKHYEYFKDTLLQKLSNNSFNKKQRFIVITDGTDIETMNAIKYWKEKGLSIDILPYRIYNIENQYIFEFNQYNPNDDVVFEEENGFFIVNTNITWSKNNYKEMLNEGKAAGYYDRKSGIKNIRKGNIVFLYHTGVGIIAYGKATTDYLKKNINKDIDEEYYVKINFDWKIDPDNESDKAVKSYEINQALNSGHRFRLTCFSISEEIGKTIIKLAKSKK